MKIRVLSYVYLCFAPVFCLRGVRIQTPVAVIKGEDTTLYCWYDTEGDPLYIVKWYKSGREFYRYVPRESPAIKTFPVGNLQIKESGSNSTQVTLMSVDTDAAGSFSCEVSADAPSFQTAIVSGTMNVVELPSQRPVISGLRNKYRVNDILRLNCSSALSRPAANLTWFVNSRQVSTLYVRTYVEMINSKDNITKSSLLFPIIPESFYNGKLKIRCSASIYDIYWQSTEVSAEEERLRVPYSGSKSNVVEINYHQPPPNYQLGQKKLNGEIDIKVIGTSGTEQIPRHTTESAWMMAFLIFNLIMS